MDPQWGPKLRDPIGDPIGTQIVGPNCFRCFAADVLHKIWGPTIWVPFGSPIGSPNLGPTFCCPSCGCSFGSPIRSVNITPARLLSNTQRFRASELVLLPGGWPGQPSSILGVSAAPSYRKTQLEKVGGFAPHLFRWVLQWEGAVTNALATNKNQWPRRVAFARAFCKKR